MSTKSLFLSLLGLAVIANSASAANVRITMNNVSKTMTLVSATTFEPVDVGKPANLDYTLNLEPDTYRLTAYATDGKTVNGTIELTVSDTDNAEQQFKLITCTVYATNKNADGSLWTTANGDYSLSVNVNTREGLTLPVTIGNSTTTGRNTFLALNGNSYYAAITPSQAHRKEGFTTLYRSGTLTANINISANIPKGADYIISAPADAVLSLGMKFAHFIDYTPVEPTEVSTRNGITDYTFYLAEGQTYNYRTSIDGKMTLAGYFTMAADESKRPQISFSSADYDGDPSLINHSPQANQGYETGDIFININPQGHLRLNDHERFRLHAMRSWELTDNSTNNYFMEPDFHYVILDLNGQPTDSIVRITQSPGSAWAELEAVGRGEAIVIATYDAIRVNYYSSTTKTPYMGGELWGAIWPENSAAFIVSVGADDCIINPGIVINEAYNNGTLKLAGKQVDAEHDVFYYLDSEGGYPYTFTPQGAVSVAIAYPTISEKAATYNGFSTDGITANADGSYTALLRHGRQIIRLTDAAGNSVYQVLTAKQCHREIINSTRPGSQIYQPGDEVKVQYSGLYHPANKLAGIYNMSAYVTYNGIPNGSSLILGSGQYTFGSAASAQAVTIKIPAAHNVAAEPQILMTDGVIQVNGYGDPIGNHRNIDPVAGRSPNFTAVPHKTYFGSLPDLALTLSEYKTFPISIEASPTPAELKILFNGQELTPDSSGNYNGTYGTYSIVASRPGYRCYRRSFTISDSAEGLQVFSVNLVQDSLAWDGKSTIEPERVDDVYRISTPAALAWLANEVNTKGSRIKAELTADIDLGDYDWTPIGTSSKPFIGSLSGNGHCISGLYFNNPTAQYAGLIGYVKGTSAEQPTSITGLDVSGSVNAKAYAGGIAGYVHAFVEIDTCANHADITVANSNCGGIAGYVGYESSRISNSCNTGNLSAASNCGGIVGSHPSKGIDVKNVYNIGEINCPRNAGGCVGSSGSKTGVSNAFSTTSGNLTDGSATVTDRQMASGEIAYLLGDAFGQKLGEEPYPVLRGAQVFYNPETDSYFNTTTHLREHSGPTDDQMIEAYYNLRGTRSSTPFKGVNIIRFRNGSTRKINL